MSKQVAGATPVSPLDVDPTKYGSGGANIAPNQGTPAGVPALGVVLNDILSRLPNQAFILAITGGGVAGAPQLFPIPLGKSTKLRFSAMGKVTTKGGGTESVGDSYDLETIIAAKNVGGTVSIITNRTEVSETDADASMTNTSYAFTVSGTSVALTITNATGLNAGTVVTHTVDVQERDY